MNLLAMHLWHEVQFECISFLKSFLCCRKLKKNHSLFVMAETRSSIFTGNDEQDYVLLCLQREQFYWIFLPNKSLTGWAKIIVDNQVKYVTKEFSELCKVSYLEKT